jgi:hypothetical protein
MRLWRYDDLAKDPNAVTPGLEHFLPAINAVLSTRTQTSGIAAGNVVRFSQHTRSNGCAILNKPAGPNLAHFHRRGPAFAVTHNTRND